MKLILLSPPDFFVEEDKILTSLFEEGLDLLYLRKPKSEPVYSERLLTLLPEKYHKQVLVYEHFYLKEEFNLMGIHLSRHNPTPPHDYQGIISRSCYTLDELKECKKNSDFVLLSHVFDSLSDHNVNGQFTNEQLHRAAREGLIDRKVMAMGGVCLENIDRVREYGFGGAALRGDLWNRFNIHSGCDYKEVINHFRRIRKIAD